MEKELDSKERLEFISDMIRYAKMNYHTKGSFYFLLWGWVVSLANIGHYVLDVYQLYDRPYVVWLIAIPAAVASFWYGYKSASEATTFSHLDRIYSSLWICISAMIVLCLLFMSKVNYNHNAMILLFAGLGTFINGILMRFRPLIFGAVILWVGSCMGFLSSVSDQQLIAGLAVMVGYIVPGYLLKKAEKDHV